MKAFSFRLDRLLRLKADAEQQQARVMGNAAREEVLVGPQVRFFQPG